MKAIITFVVIIGAALAEEISDYFRRPERRAERAGRLTAMFHEVWLP